MKKPSWWTGRFLKKPVPIKHWVDFKDPTRTACGFLQNDTHPIADRKSEVDCPECIKALKGNVPVRPPVVEEPEPKRKVMRRPNADWNF